ncbi:MAG: hypothetical protein B7Y39_01750 [Bdellovibrio sp. 28-41-41]|nr:MAG: hypothetical protein B7Y39_01750 [Bdellovibrio sp. 28-41-41]
MKSLFAVLFLGLVSFAAEPQTTIQTRTTVGKSMIVAIGSCNLPMGSFGTISSNFAYSVCQENITAQYEVSGKGWNKDYKLVPGTAQSTYSVEQKQNGHSQFVSEEEANLFNFVSVQTACMSIRQATAGSVVHISQTPCGQTQQ